MDMEHQLLHLERFMASSPGFFTVDSGQDPAHFPNGGLFVEQVGATGGVGGDDGGWVEDLMQLGEELFGGRGDANGTDDGMGDDHYYQQWQCDDGGSPDGGPPPSVSLDGDASPPSGEQEQGTVELASERHPHREAEDGDDDVLGATRKRRDRSKTIVSERKRRVRMKEKLYELRALVPNITKMDKASIIADAVVYVKNLQAHARKLKEEVAALEARPRSPTGQHSGPAGAGRRRHQQQQQERRRDAGRSAGSGARVTHVGAVQVGEGRFFVTVECERRDGVAAPLCAAAESLACFRVETSSVGGRSGPDRVVSMSTLTLKGRGQLGDAAAIGEASVKLWMMAALVKEGFRPAATVQIS
ncbi:Transcription factor FER-LIKE IRON DEFICIENCY-INDUCED TRANSCRIPTION FACTOR [Zea mays]|uniref:Transcription factor FER-LIKE IRON DEFICIENCY-INDUCED TRANSCRIPTION FACTOR n=2 Tax=Zea mays TaxID=4577 RepID=A0A3L6FTQ6_MAIZE|eukprot:XP_008670013.1 transcription factor FER-LIKE IRON DEFICIENCY-INDUCED TRANSCRIPTION FACTOR [Zea mays]